MKSAAIVSALLGATAALAAPRSVAQPRGLRSASGQRAMSRPNMYKPTNETDTTYSTNWSGAVLVGTGFTSVTATMVVPKIPANSGGTKYGSAWVGIDGDTCDALWQTGISWTTSGSSTTYEAWYEWIPAASIDYSSFSVSAGDTLKMTVTASSKTGGTATIENLTTGKTATHTVSKETTSLCEYNAEWIVEDFAFCENASCSEYELAPFANYGTVEFTSASAVSSGTTVGLTGATLFTMSTNDEASGAESSCTNTASTVTCSYV